MIPAPQPAFEVDDARWQRLIRRDPELRRNFRVVDWKGERRAKIRCPECRASSCGVVAKVPPSWGLSITPTPGAVFPTDRMGDARMVFSCSRRNACGHVFDVGIDVALSKIDAALENRKPVVVF